MFKLNQYIPELGGFINKWGMLWKGNSQGIKRKGSTNSPANPILTNFTYSESLSILPPSES